MKRLKNILLDKELSLITYADMYDGAMRVIPPNGILPWGDCCPVYYNGEVGFDISHTHKLAQDKPTVTVIIPLDMIFPDTEGVTYLKRLKYYLLGMENDTTTYKEMYNAEVIAYPCNYPEQPEYKDNDHKYFYGDISFDIASTNKLSQDKPTITYRIPAEKLGMDTFTATAADFYLREFGRYIDELNEPLYNRSRPDDENGKYYITRPGGEVLKRNSAYFELCAVKDYENGSERRYFSMTSVTENRRKCVCALSCRCSCPSAK